MAEEPMRRRDAEAEPAHRRADEAERTAGEEPVVDLGPVDGRLLEDDGLRRQALCERGQHVARRQRLAGPPAERAAAGSGTAVAARRPRCGSRPASARATGRGRRENGQLDRAAVRLGRVVADERDARALLGEAARRPRGLAERARSDARGRRRTAASRSRRRGRSAGRTPANRRMVLREAGAGTEGLLEDGCDEPLRQLDERLPRLGLVGAGADDERRRASALEEGRELRRPPLRRRRARAARAPAEASSRSGSASCSQSSIGTITIAGPRAVAASW